MSLKEALFKAGVVGQGGAGFPTHVKAGSSVEFMLANGAECEPLVHKDLEIMVAHPEEIVRGFELMKNAVGAARAFFGIKKKNARAVKAIGEALGDVGETTLLGDFYPSGDEYELVYEATGRLIEPGGIPLGVGCVVNNVETLYNVARAEAGVPLTDTFLSVNGAVQTPAAFFAPVGTSIRECLDAAGGATVPEPAVFVGGAMMGRLTFDLDEPTTKTTAGFIVLPRDHYLVTRMNREERAQHRIGKSACDQCSYCTEFCPRYLLGYNVQPHKVMRSLEFTKTGADVWNQMAELCCECGLCTLYACPEDLYPREACQMGKREMRKLGIDYEQKEPPRVHPMKEGRRVPIKQLVKKLHIAEYDRDTPYLERGPEPTTVRILLSQHVGAPSEPVVSKGDRVSKGDLVAEPPKDALGARMHASIEGEVVEVASSHLTIKR
ncbi:MAG: NADH dehydrogenase subunit [Ignavibacteriales bacterium]|nr:NADH dehydrogenase subunit [Ignavibacteriales bacterium]